MRPSVPDNSDIIEIAVTSHLNRNVLPGKRINNKHKIMPALFTSPRFLGIVAVGILQALVLFNVISSVQGDGLINIISGIIAAAVAVGSLDRIGSQVS